MRGLRSNVWRARLRGITRKRLGGLLLLALLLIGYWWLPIEGRILILTDTQREHLGFWPQISIDPPAARPGEEAILTLRDTQPWAHVKLSVAGVVARRDEQYPTGSGPWQWRWRFTVPLGRPATAVFYHSCHTGCIERSRIQIGDVVEATAEPARIPTKLGVVFADAQRDWHGRAGWTVELTYTQRPDDATFGVDGLAWRVHQARRKGLRVLVRVAYDYQQALPPVDDELALARYLDGLARLARDDRLREVYGYVIGSGYNTQGENRLTPDRITTPQWYARVFTGDGLAPMRADNAVQTIRSIRPETRVLVGPVTPWTADGDGTRRDPLNQPWLNYFNTLVAHLDDATRAKAEAGIALAGPDGFALQAPGRPAAADDPAREPATDLHRREWGRAQAGFRVYRDWLAIINRYAATQGLPAYITSTNTWTIDSQIPPAQNYPAGWLTTAVAAINAEPQIQALCWFLDAPLGEFWEAFSLSRHLGHLNDAAEEFDRLLRE
ncbi:hypothetical protein [Kallotenue papyrolyticum]|uniref:hypothetical protein n=1 Tax=Kallotenue papyrolyticum TaxID=1325125 RepID=UPI0004785D34|nr:hypothetical protein [Kallotenue papyrolyticum]